MFSHTLSRWGRWIGLGSVSTAVEERRVWVRHPCSLETNVTPANEAEGERIPARVADISRGGIRLIADRAFEPGELLSVDLPSSEGGSSTMLTCVVHVRTLAEGEWVVGCSFAAELSDEDLALFNLGRRASRSDQRAHARYPCRARARYQSIHGDSSVLLSAEVLNVSGNGVALKVEVGLMIGELINLELRRETDELVVTTLASVVRVEDEVEGHQVIGCNFIAELSEQQLTALLSGAVHD
jgi:c-di-GMP-binding flagellar brake protein YcgR